jgi:hypothetical protein
MGNDAAEMVSRPHYIFGLYLVESVGFTLYVLLNYVFGLHSGSFHNLSDLFVCELWMVLSWCYALDSILLNPMVI